MVFQIWKQIHKITQWDTCSLSSYFYLSHHTRVTLLSFLLYFILQIHYQNIDGSADFNLVNSAWIRPFLDFSLNLSIQVYMGIQNMKWSLSPGMDMQKSLNNGILFPFLFTSIYFTTSGAFTFYIS